MQLTVRGNFTYAHNTILDNDQPRWAEPYLNKIGQSNWQEYGLVAAGLFSSQEEIDAWPTQAWGEVHPGDIKYLDLNGDGKVGMPDIVTLIRHLSGWDVEISEKAADMNSDSNIGMADLVLLIRATV